MNILHFSFNFYILYNIINGLCVFIVLIFLNELYCGVMLLLSAPLVSPIYIGDNIYTYINSYYFKNK